MVEDLEKAQHFRAYLIVSEVSYYKDVGTDQILYVEDPSATIFVSMAEAKTAEANDVEQVEKIPENKEDDAKTAENPDDASNYYIQVHPR